MEVQASRTTLIIITFRIKHGKPVVTLCMLLWQQIHFCTVALFFQTSHLIFKLVYMHKVESTNLCSDQWACVEYFQLFQQYTCPYPTLQVMSCKRMNVLDVELSTYSLLFSSSST